MTDILRSLYDYLSDNWPELVWLLAAAFMASFLAGRRARMQWERREFLDRLNVSLNSIDNGCLKIRTILEMDVRGIFLNRTAAERIVALSKKTTESDPLIPIPSSDRWYYLNAVLNEVSERFAVGQLRRDAGLKVDSHQYLLCLTCERAGAVRTHKIRAMLIRKDLLTSLPDETPSYESPNHSTRWETLNFLAARYEDSPESFLELEICF